MKINLPCGRISLTDLKLHHFILRSAKKRHKRIIYLQGGCRVAKITLNEKEKELDIDLWIIMIVSFISFGIFMIFQKDIYGFIKNEKVPILSRVLLAATFQYGLAGFGITIVSILRKESFLSYGLKTRGMFSSIYFVFCALFPI